MTESSTPQDETKGTPGFTPGPWEVYGNGREAEVRGADLTIVAIRHRLPAAEHEANARLIAAAPEMYEALVGMLKATEDSIGKQYRDRAKRALAKASPRHEEGE